MPPQEEALLEKFWFDWAREIDPNYRRGDYPFKTYEFVYLRVREKFAYVLHPAPARVIQLLLACEPETWTVEDRAEINKSATAQQAEFDQHFASVASDRMDAFKKSQAT